MSSGEGRLAGKRILVVDDNVVNLKLACEILQGEGYVVDRAGDAAEALALLERIVPDLILMDIALPGMDGLTLTRNLKAQPRFERVPIVALTAFAMKGDDQRAAAVGCEGYISKPIDTRRFPEQVAGFLEQRRTPPAGGAIKVMVIEDDDTDLKLVSLVLARSGLLVQHKVSADGVIDAILTHPPDVILLDVRLPGMDGRALARVLKSDARIAAIPIVAVTAFPSLYSSEELRDAGCEMCIVKPIDTRELPRTLEELVHSRPASNPGKP
jgi:two-component system cell cycle response regulator